MTTTLVDKTIDRAWGEFIVFASAHAEGWLFRGHAQASYELRPMVGRPNVCGPTGYVEKNEKGIADVFQSEAVRFVAGTGFDDLDWLAVAQHHGLPTRLLDWTTNPLVAAWFALRSGDLAGPEIHAIQVPMKDRHAGVDPWNPHAEVVIVRVPAKAARITAQQGCFSLHREPDKVWDPARAGVAHDRHALPASEPAREVFLARLKAFGVDDARMRADLDGIGADLAWTFRRLP